MGKKFIFISLLMLSLMFIGTSWTMAASYNVTMGDMTPPCGGFGAADIGFVDCNTTMTGGIIANAVTNILLGDSVIWTMGSTPHTTTSNSSGTPTAPTPGACATGDNWDSNLANAFTPGFVFTHTFSAGTGACLYYCIIHPTTMYGTVNVAGPATTTTVAPTTTTLAVTTTTAAPTTTTLAVTTTTAAPTTTTVAPTTTTVAPTTTTLAVTTTTAAPTTTTLAATTTTAAPTTTTVRVTTTTLAPTTTTTVTTSTVRPTTTTSTSVSTTTTTTQEKCNDQAKGKGKDKGKAKGKCKGHNNDKGK